MSMKRIYIYKAILKLKLSLDTGLLLLYEFVDKSGLINYPELFSLT
jgi:hypothetical protein